jgi:prepilin-type processing-associated H-X9-DG protein
MFSGTSLCIRNRNFRNGSTVVTVITLVALAAFFAALLVPSVGRSRETANRVKCASNMRQIGQAILLYSNENHGAYPRTIYQGGDQVIPDVTNAGFDSSNPFTADTKVPANCIPASLFLLLRTEDITSAVFCCPSTSAQPDQYGGGGNTVLLRSNFSFLHSNLSYSYANPFPDNQALSSGYKLTSSIDPQFAVLSDRNPGVGAGSDVLGITKESPAAEIRRGNSLNHGRDGQNILFADGHVEFDNNPFRGLNRDNIFCRGSGGPGTDKSNLVNSPQDASDSVLLPAEGN